MQGDERACGSVFAPAREVEDVCCAVVALADRVEDYCGYVGSVWALCEHVRWVRRTVWCSEVDLLQLCGAGVVFAVLAFVAHCRLFGVDDQLSKVTLTDWFLAPAFHVDAAWPWFGVLLAFGALVHWCCGMRF